MQIDTPRTELVLATGGTGDLGGRIILTQSEQRFSVRTTVRSPARDTGVRVMIASELGASATLSVHVADLLKDGGWAEVTKGAAHVIHSASARASKVPKRNMPDLLARPLALFNKDLASLVPDLGREWTADSSKAKRLLGWQARPPAELPTDAAARLLDNALV